VSAIGDAVVWLNDPLNWQGREGIPNLALDQLQITAVAVGVGALVALPVALVLGHYGRGGGVVVALGNLTRAIPTYALLTIFASSPIGFGNRATTVALMVFAVPPILANTYTGIRQVDRDIVESARGMGLSEGQLLRRVEVPLAVPLIAAGFRTAVVQVLATATLSAFVGGGTLGLIITNGFGTQDYGKVIAGGVLVAALAVLVDLLLGAVERAVTPGRVRPFRRLRRVPVADGVA
jgi:osmoprotectant transport system permease protein